MQGSVKPLHDGGFGDAPAPDPVSAIPAIVRKDLDAQIARTVAELSSAAFPTGLRSVVLTGSVARGEGTWLRDGARIRLAGDAEFMMFFDQSAIPNAEPVARLKAAAEIALAERRIDAQIGLSQVGVAYLHRLRPHIFAYELRAHGKVVLGDQGILELAPAFSVAEIPLEDGFRLLMNRTIELLGAVCELEEGEMISDAVRYCALKLSLDIATSLLLFEGRYESTYRARATRLCELAAASKRGPLPMRRFAERVAYATRCKLGESDGIGTDGAADLIGLAADVHSLWRWELQRLVGVNAPMSDGELMRRWVTDQEMLERARGWASVARRYGAMGSLGHLPGWMIRAAKGSPRRTIYAAASELFAALPALLPGAIESDCGSRWDDLRRELPACNGSAAVTAISAQRRLGRAIAWNYRRFLEFTRA